MKTHSVPFAAALALMVLLAGCERSTNKAGNTGAATQGASPNPSAESHPIDSMDFEAAAERMRQTSAQMKGDMQQARARRDALEARHEQERQSEVERARQQAIKDAAQLASIKNAKDRQALEAAQASARQEAMERTAKAERDRKAALEAQLALERNQAKSHIKEPTVRAPVTKPAGGAGKLGTEVNFGSDI